MRPPPSRRRPRPGPGLPGFSLAEVMIVAVLIGILAAMAVPSYRCSVEQARADQAAANLRTLWAAGRLYSLEHRATAVDPADLVALGVLRPGEVRLLSPSGTFLMYDDPSYVYQLGVDAFGAFGASAARAGGGAFGGTLTIDGSGAVGGQLVNGHGRVIRPGFR